MQAKPNSKHAPPAYLLVGTAFLIIAGIFFLPQVISTTWHLIHGNSAQFHQWDIPVPQGWWAFTTNGTLIVQKMQKSVARDSQVAVNNLPLPAGEIYDYEKEKVSSIEQMSREGYRFLEERKTLLAGEECFCMSFSDPHSREYIRIACDTPNHRLFLYYAGDKAYSSALDLIIQHTRKRE